MSRRRAKSLLVLAGLLAVLTGLLLTRPSAKPDPRRRPGRGLIAQARVDALAGVARRLYFQEVYGTPNADAFNLISRLPGLVAGLETGDFALAARTLNQVMADHIVRQRVTRGSRTLVDVGLPFVVAGQRRPLRAANRTYLGRVEVSIQDVIGLIKLFHRFTGADMVVRGHPGHLKSSLPAARRLALPAAGPVSVAGRAYFVSSFTRVGFAGEPLTIWILVPAG